MQMDDEADICLILEGTYPYVSGGVAGWAHDLVKAHKERSFTLVCILPPDEKNPKQKYELPENIVGVKNLWLQELPEGSFLLKNTKDLFQNLEMAILNLQHDKNAFSGFKKA